MIELLRSNDVVLISYIEALLADGGIEIVILDQHMSMLEGGIFALTRRVMVDEDDDVEAHALLKNAGIACAP